MYHESKHHFAGSSSGCLVLGTFLFIHWRKSSAFMGDLSVWVRWPIVVQLRKKFRPGRFVHASNETGAGRVERVLLTCSAWNDRLGSVLAAIEMVACGWYAAMTSERFVSYRGKKTWQNAMTTDLHVSFSSNCGTMSNGNVYRRADSSLRSASVRLTTGLRSTGKTTRFSETLSRMRRPGNRRRMSLAC
jgi:hypothetical protein